VLEFEFEAQSLSKLISDLRAAATIPTHKSDRAN
jgi:hypothetical protein